MRKRVAVALTVVLTGLVAAAGGSAIGERRAARGYEFRSGDQAFMRQAGMRCYMNQAANDERQFLQSRVVAGCTPLVRPFQAYVVRMTDRGIIVFKSNRVLFRHAVR